MITDVIKTKFCYSLLKINLIRYIGFVGSKMYDEEKSSIKNGRYYMMIHKGTKKALYLPEKSKNFEKEEPTLVHPDEK